MSRDRNSPGSLDCKIYVGDLPKDATENEIERAFATYGRVKNVWVARNPSGFAFVEYEDTRDAEDAVRNLDGNSVCGVRVRVEFSTGKSRTKPWDAPTRRAPPPPSGRRFNPDDRCYECGERGHYAYDCEQRASGKKRFGAPPSRRSRSRSRRKSRSSSRSGSDRRKRSRSRSGRKRSRSDRRRGRSDSDRRYKRDRSRSGKRSGSDKKSKSRSRSDSRSNRRNGSGKRADSRKRSRSPSDSLRKSRSQSIKKSKGVKERSRSGSKRSVSKSRSVRRSPDA